MEEENQPEVMQELLLKLMNDLQILKGIQPKQEEPTVQSFTPYGNFSMIDDVEVLMKDIYTFLRKFSRIPFRVTPKDEDDEYTIIYRKPKAITPDLPTVEPDNSLIMGDEHLSTIPKTESDEVIKSSVENLVPIPSEFEGISEDTSIFEDIEYVSLEEVNDVDQEEKEFDLEDILQIQDVILREKLLNISRLITNIESLNDNPTPTQSQVLLPYDHTEETRSGSTTTHANNSLPEFESFHFDLYDDPSFPRPPPEPPDVEISLIIKTDAPVINNFDELNEDECFDPGGDEIDVEDDDSFTFVIRTFLPFLTYPVDSPFLYSFGSEDTIFDPGISI
ncbi:hypothetical protein Tco_0921186 [Tanacetum coccineum]